MSWLGTRLRRFAERHLEERRITHKGKVYLRRFYLFGAMPPALAESWNCGELPKQRLGWLPTTYLHCFHEPDLRPECHSHPWTAVGMILTGGYIEKRYDRHPSMPGAVTGLRKLRPGQFQAIEPNTFHNVVGLCADTVWTIIVVGAKVQTWGYWIEDEGRFAPWRELHSDVNNDS